MTSLAPPTRPTPQDLAAGASVALVLIPQAMAYAELAGLPPQIGLFAAALPLLLAAPFASSVYLQTGPVALTALLTFGALEGLAEPSTPDYIALAALLALLVGACRALLGVMKLGRIAYLLSNPVLTGFTSGAAILIISSQLPNALGAKTDGDHVLVDGIQALVNPAEWQLATIAFAAFTSVAMIGGRRLHPLFPGVLLAVSASTIASQIFDYRGPTIGSLPGGFVELRFDFPWGSTGDLIIAAVAIALVGFAEPSSIARSYATADRQPWDANREMFSQGVANLAAGFSGGMPVGGSFSRSALNRTAGARTRWSGAATGLVVLLALPFTPLLEPLPRSVLAALIITPIVTLIDLKRLWRLIRESAPQAVVGFGTLAATLAFSPRVERGVLIGAALAICVHLYRELTVTVKHDIDGPTMRVCPQGVLWFATVPQIEQIVRSSLATHPEVDRVIFDLAGVGRLDYTGGETFDRVIAELIDGGILVEVINVPPGAARAIRIHVAERLTASPDAPSSPPTP